MGVIFVAGIYAVGKTTACSQAAQLLEMPHFTASSVIRSEQSTAIPEQGKAVKDIGGNQVFLIRGVQRALDESKRAMILDGHFTIPNSNGQLEFVDVEVFRELRIKGVIVFHDEPSAIAARFNLRDGEDISVEGVANHQLAELEHAYKVCNELAVPLVKLTAFDVDGLSDAIRQML